MTNILDQIKLLNLTEEDFKLLVEGLEALPQRNLASDIMGDIMLGMIAKGNKEEQDKLLEERKKRVQDQKAQKELLIENVKILQGKLLMLKRYMQENKLLKDAYEILGIPGNDKDRSLS